MTRRSLCAFIGAVLLAALAAPAQAKPPDLPLPYQDQVTPRYEPVELVDYVVEQTSPWAAGYLMLEVGVPAGGTFAVPTLVPLGCPVEADLSEDALEPVKPIGGQTIAVSSFGGFGSSPPAVQFGFSGCPVTDAMAKLRPSIRRQLAGAVLFGVHPLLALMPVEGFLDFPCDHPAPVVFVAAPGCPYAMPECHPCPQCPGNRCGSEKCEPQKETAHEVVGPQTHGYPGCPDMVPPCPVIICPSQNCQPAKTVVCPYVKQQSTDRHAVQIADPAVTCTVLENLDRVMKANRLFRQGQALVEQGRICEALDCFCEAQQMCPGRFEEQVSESLNALVNTDREDDSHPGATEEAEAPACQESGCCPCFQTMMRWMGCYPVQVWDARGQERMKQLRQQAEELREIGDEWNRVWGEREQKKTGGITLATSAVKKRLKVKVDVSYDAAPLNKVLDDIQTLAGVNIVCEEDVDLDQLVTAEAEKVSLKKVLKHILHEAGLKASIEAGQVKVGRKMNTVTYAIGHLTPLAPCAITGQASGAHNRDVPCALIGTLTAQVSPRTWEVHGGRGTIDYDPTTRSLIVTQTDAVHKQIADYLVDVCQLLHFTPEDEAEDVNVVSGVPCEPDESCTPCPRCAELHEKIAVRLQVDGLLKACRLEVVAGRHGRAAELAREAYALDPERVQGEPLVYKMHLLQVSGDAEACEPAARACDCKECPKVDKCDDCSCPGEPGKCSCKETKCKDGCSHCKKEAKADCQTDCPCCKEKSYSAEACEPAKKCDCKECPKGGKCDGCSCPGEAEKCSCKETKCKDGCKCDDGCKCCKKEAKAGCQADCSCCKEAKPGSAEEAEVSPKVSFTQLMQKLAPASKRMGEVEVELGWKGIRLKGSISVGPHKVHLRHEPRGTILWLTPVGEPR